MPPDGLMGFRPNVDSRRELPSRSTALQLTQVRRDVLVNHDSHESYDPRVLSMAFADMRQAVLRQKVDDWIADTQWFSSISSITRHPEFEEIRKMGPLAMKFVLERMVEGDVRVHWFPLLKDISGEDPVPASKRGAIRQMAQAWIKWGRARGHLSG